MTLPTELLDQICSHLGSNADTDTDTNCLSLTCKSLWIQLLPTVRRILIANHAPWAGQRLWVRGDLTDSVPDSLMDLDELTRMCKICRKPIDAMAAGAWGHVNCLDVRLPLRYKMVMRLDGWAIDENKCLAILLAPFERAFPPILCRPP